VSGGLTAGVTNIAGGGQINNAVSRSVTQASVDSSLRGEDFQESLKNNLKAAAVSMVAEKGAKEISCQRM
jgi:hypothetical protein